MAGMAMAVSSSPTAPTGRLMRKIQCHEAACVSQPPSGGPSSGPISPGTATKLMACKKRSFGYARSTASRPTGMSMAPPAPCSTRAATSCASELLAAHAAEPPMNSRVAAPNTRRVPKRSASQPLEAISTAIVSE